MLNKFLFFKYMPNAFKMLMVEIISDVLTIQCLLSKNNDSNIVLLLTLIFLLCCANFLVVFSNFEAYDMRLLFSFFLFFLLYIDFFIEMKTILVLSMIIVTLLDVPYLM